ncbi:sulfotransferase 1B1-like [Physella acuta]|uniref:sulfotransferase 1B1-like n=1 Tax=Physella acuta TaxID=109671 RepID=UPI0027DB5776|nr:sulfotransferase 1B1-like [Physella acuta]
MDDLTISLKRKICFQDTAGVKDGAGKILPLTRMPNGRLFPPFGEEYVNNIKTIKLRPDDVFVCGYPKTGCHWTWEIMQMIIKGKAEHSDIGKMQNMLELAAPEVIEASPSPRILNTHAWFEELPEEVKKFRSKIVFTTRNPKDVAVSHYNHHVRMKNIYCGYDGQFKDWMQLWINGTIEYGSFLEFHCKWDAAIQENPDHPILVLSYEEMKNVGNIGLLDLEGTVRQIAKFLEVDLTEAQVQEITGASQFDSMKDKFKGTPCELLIRKGQVGDWKNWFTVALSEEVDKWKPELDKTRFTFRYV